MSRLIVPGKMKREAVSCGQTTSNPILHPPPPALSSASCHFRSLVPLATPSLPFPWPHPLCRPHLEPITPSGSAAVPWAFPCPSPVPLDGSGLFTLCLPLPMTDQAAGTGSDPPLCPRVAQTGPEEVPRKVWGPTVCQGHGSNQAEEQREVTGWESCGQPVIKGLLTELRKPLMATKGAREFQERSPRVRALPPFPGSLWAGQARLWAVWAPARLSGHTEMRPWQKTLR